MKPRYVGGGEGGKGVWKFLKKNFSSLKKRFLNFQRFTVKSFRFFAGAYNTTYSSALRQPEFYLKLQLRLPELVNWSTQHVVYSGILPSIAGIHKGDRPLVESSSFILWHPPLNSQNPWGISPPRGFQRPIPLWIPAAKLKKLSSGEVVRLYPPVCCYLLGNRVIKVITLQINIFVNLQIAIRFYLFCV